MEINWAGRVQVQRGTKALTISEAFLGTFAFGSSRVRPVRLIAGECSEESGRGKLKWAIPAVRNGCHVDAFDSFLLYSFKCLFFGDL